VRDYFNQHFICNKPLLYCVVIIDIPVNSDCIMIPADNMVFIIGPALCAFIVPSSGIIITMITTLSN